MTKKIIHAFYCFCLLTVSSLFGQILQFDSQPIEKIDIVLHSGKESKVDNQSLLARLRTKRGGYFSQTAFDEDLKNLSQNFDRVEPQIEAIDQKVYITLNVWPKPIIHSIQWNWQGPHQIETRRLQRELGITCFSTYERQSFNQAFHKLRAYFTRKGFFEAELDYQVVANPETNEVNIIIDISEGRSGKIEDIAFVNFTPEEENEILQLMVTKTFNRFTSWINQEGTYNEEAIQHDQLVIINYLQNEGYADADVNISLTNSQADRIILTITADRGERYYFGCISFEGHTVFTDEQISRLIATKPGLPYSIQTISETLEKIKEAYGRLGYIDAFVDFVPELVEGGYLHNVNFKIEEGQQYRVGLIRIFGNMITQTSVILHETLLTPGEVFNSIKLKKTEERLQNIGYFKNVNVYAVRSEDTVDASNPYRDVYIEVEETNTGHFSAFLGYSGVEEIFGGINISENNFNYKGFSLLGRDGLGALRGGGEYALFTAQIGQKSSSYNLSWTKPHFMDTKWAVGFDLTQSSTRYISKEYDLNNISLLIRAQYEVNAFLRAGVYYRLKNSYVNLRNHHKDCSDSSSDSEYSDYDFYSSYWGEDPRLVKESRIRGLISAIGTTLTYDSVNTHLCYPKGFRSRLSMEFAGVGGDHKFLSLSYLNNYYMPVGSRSLLKYQADFRFIQPLGTTRFSTIPLDERLFLGGEYTVRGYRPYRIGPQYWHHVPRGGLSLQFYSVEFDRRLMKDVEAFIFMDAGHLSKNTWEFGRLSVAVGYGARFKIIPSVPRITLGMGYPLNPKNRSEIKRFFISIGETF